LALINKSDRPTVIWRGFLEENYLTGFSIAFNIHSLIGTLIPHKEWWAVRGEIDDLMIVDPALHVRSYSK